jgi:HK97 gp10 family phage protein
VAKSGKGVSIKIAGLGSLQKSLDALPSVMAKKVIRSSIRDALRPVKRAVEANAPTGDTLAIKRSVKIRAGKKVKRGRIGATVVIGEGDFLGKTFYAAFREYGHAIRKINRGPVVGRVAPLRFMGRAYDSTGPTARSDAVRRIKERLPAAIKAARAARGK